MIPSTFSPAPPRYSASASPSSIPCNFAAADHIGGSAVGVIVIFLGIRVVHDTAIQLMDTMPDPAAMDRIRMTGLNVPGVLGIEKCFARKTGLKWHVDLHLEVDPAMSVYESHEIATRVREKIRSEVDWVADVLVHVEPHMLATIAVRAHMENREFARLTRRTQCATNATAGDRR